MAVAIKIENLSKQYRLGLVSTRTLSHDLNRWWQTSVLGREDPYLKIGESNVRETKGVSEYVWALKDINLEVREGEVLGIIGKNGAGKSTLLKILSKVTSPTTGTIKARGRIASLLEVGTGFHQEMTGRENIFMNGAIMGMTKAEIRRKFDEIVDFAGVERYIDTPVKRYSSGMTVRLGFSVAAHLEPEILVVDEVLAVGDAEFQKKAIGKMQDVTKSQERTVLFVSHNMSAIQALCKTSILLQNGNLINYNETAIVVNNYLKDTNINKEFKREMLINNDATIVYGKLIEYLLETEIQLIIDSKMDLKISLDVRLTDAFGGPIGFGSFGTFNKNELILLSKGQNQIKFNIDTSHLALGEYSISLDITIPDVKYIDRIEGCLSFEIIRKPNSNAFRVLKQNWRYGSYVLDLKLKECYRG